MKKLVLYLFGISALMAMAAPVAAQSSPRPLTARDVHYQIGMMERVLEGAVEHGATIVRDRLQAVAPDAPAQMLILGSPRVRGFRLDGYGVFFDVEVPSLNGTLTWSLRTLDENDLGLQSALNTIKAWLDPSDVDLQQALKRVELQVGPPASAARPTTGTTTMPASSRAPRLPSPRRPAGSAANASDPQVGAASVSPSTSPAQAAAPQPDDRILENPNETYREEVVQALADAMLDHGAPLGIGPDEWLTIAARGIQDQPHLGPPDNDAQTVMIRLRGADLAAFRSNQISRDEVIKRMDRRVF
jgi:hypothetical protein